MIKNIIATVGLIALATIAGVGYLMLWLGIILMPIAIVTLPVVVILFTVKYLFF